MDPEYPPKGSRQANDSLVAMTSPSPAAKFIEESVNHP